VSQAADTAAPLILETGAGALKNAAAWLAVASSQIEAARGNSDGAQLMAEEVRDLLTRVKAEGEKLQSTLSGN
jgi:hypothetical protein